MNYSLKQIQKEINWLSPKGVLTFLADNGVRPTSELQLGARIYRQFDAAAMKRVKVLRREYLQRINGQQVVPHQPAPAPEPQPTAVAPDQLERMTQIFAGIAARVATLTLVIDRIDEMNAKIDKLIAVWDDGPQVAEAAGGAD